MGQSMSVSMMGEVTVTEKLGVIVHVSLSK